MMTMFEWWENTREQTSMPESARAYIYGTIHQYTSILSAQPIASLF